MLKRSELPRPIVGRLTVSDWGGPHTANKHNRRLAEIWVKTYSVTDRPSGLGLFDPELIKVDSAGMYLQGCEVDSSADGKVFEHVQVWLIRSANEEVTDGQ